MKAYYLTGGDAETRAAVRELLAGVGMWAAAETDADGVVVLLQARTDWALWNEADRVVAGIAFDRRYAGGDGSEGAPIFAAEETERLRLYLASGSAMLAAASAETYEYDGCLW
ncbi:hypothetical protein MO973_15120 [Paenibacillus sp. TRM 82003]|nr:hypothetical protein [Paenibacillus sp. TRM 82003]